jgi:hypothetical protein
MRSLIPVLLPAVFLLGSLNSAAQSAKTDPALDSMNKLTADSLHNQHYKVAVESRLPGGAHAWFQYLSENLQYPKKAARKKVEGRSWFSSSWKKTERSPMLKLLAVIRC